VSDLSLAVPVPRTASADALRRILFANVLSLLGDGLLLPFAALYFMAAFGFAAAAAALVLAAMTGSGVLLTAPAGALIDRLGARRATAAATLLQGVACASLAFTATLPAAVAAAVLFGAGRAVARPGVDAIIGELSEGAERTAAFAALNVAINVGFGAGAALGGLIASFGTGGLRWLFLLDAASYLVFAVVVHAAPDVRVEGRTASTGGYRAVLGDRSFLLVLAIAVTGFVALTQIDVAFSLFTVATLGLPVGIVGLAGLANTLAVIALQGPIVRRTAGQPRTRLLAFGAAGLAGCWCLAGLAEVLPGGTLPSAALIAALGTMGVAETMLVPVVFGLANDLAPDDLRGRYNGLLWGAVGSAFAIGPLAGGSLVGAGLAPVWLAGLLLCAAATAALTRPLGRSLGELC
jgi:MFS family permease